MAVVGIITNAGLTQVQQAANNQGFFIYPSGFGVSSTAGVLDPTRTTPNGGNWYGTPTQPGAISGRVVENPNTIKFICTIPPGEALGVTAINEIYLYTAGFATANYDGVQYSAVKPGVNGNSIALTFDGTSNNQTIVDNWNIANPSNPVQIISGNPANISPSDVLHLAGGGNTVLFAIGEANPTIEYDPTGQTTLELTVGVLNSNLTSQIIFDYTQATEVADHNVDPLAHPDIQQAIALAGIFPTAGQNPFSYSGQTYDERAVFDGTPAQATYHTVVYTAVRNGPLGNSINLVFDGTLTINQVVFGWNLSNPDNQVADNAPDGTVVPPAGSFTLSGGTLLVNDGDLVYSNNGVYTQALDDGTSRGNVVGIVNLTYQKVITTGFVRLTTGFPVNTSLYLSTTTPGAITDTITSVLVGTQVYSSPDVILLLTRGSGSSGGFSGYDAIVTDTPGFLHFPTTQDAINAVPAGSNILVDKLESLTAQINTSGKNMNFYFLGPETGWTRSIGSQEIQIIAFSSIPASGTWRIYWNGFIGPDLVFNATASDVQTVFEGFGLAGVIVTGNYSIGFTVTYPQNGPEPLPAFTNPGADAIQHIAFSAVPTNGCFQIKFLNNPSDTTSFFCYDNTLSQLQAFTDAVLGVGNSIWSGSFSAGFTIQYQGNLALQPIALLQIVNNGLVNGITPVVPTVTQPQPGLRPASNLKNGSNVAVVITPSELHLGTDNGPLTALLLTANKTNFFNNGSLFGFSAGLDFNGTVGHHIELTFDSGITNPILSYGAIAGRDFSIDGSVGFTNSNVPGLRVCEHPTITGRFTITGVDYSDMHGSVLAQTLNNQLLAFAGSQIDFSNGNIYAADGVTVVGTFSIPTFSPNQFLWYAIALQPGIVNADNTVPGLLTVSVGTQNSSLEAAFKPTFNTGAIPLAQIYVASDGSGNIILPLQPNVYEVSMGASTTTNTVDLGTPIFKQEVPSGAVNGINAAFGLSQMPKTTSSVLVFLNGFPVENTQYSIIGQTLTFGTPPPLGYDVYVFYVTNGMAPVYGAQEIPQGIVNGINDTYLLVGTPPNQDSLMVFVDSLEIDKQNWSFIQSNGRVSIKFLAGSIPQTGQNVYVFYLINLAALGPSSVNFIQNEGVGVGIYDKQVGGIAYFKSLLQGVGIQIIDDGLGTLTLQATGLANTDKFVRETPVGIVNGSNAVFTLTDTPLDPNSLLFSVDELPLKQSQYSLVANVVTITDPTAIPATGQSVDSYYIINQVGGGGGGGSGGWTLQNSPSTPYQVGLSGFMPDPGTTPRQCWFLSSTGGVVTPTSSPQIGAGTVGGQELLLKGTSDVNYAIFTPGAGLDLNGPISMTSNQALNLVWDGVSTWFETYRRG